MKARKTWTEAFVRDEDHVVRVTALLVKEGVAFDIRPDPDGWWRIRADEPTAAPEDRTGLHWMVQTTRMSA